MTEEIIRDGCPITIITREIEDGVYVFILEDGKEIFKCDKKLWDGNSICGFTAEIRDNIIKQIMSLYG